MPSVATWRSSIPRISAAFSRSLRFIAAAALSGPALAAQVQVTVEGQVVRRSGADTLAAPRARVVLHRVSRDVSGKFDSALADRSGRFQFRFAADTSMVYLLSANWSGIEYFGEPFPGSSLAGSVTLRLLVADTTSSAPATTGGRFIVLGGPGPARDRRAVDLFVLRNPGDRTIVGRGTTGLTWSAPLPRGVTDVRLGSAGSEISADAVRFEPGQVRVIAPLSPGEKQLLLEYTIPASVRRLEFDAVTRDTVQVVAEEQDASVDGLARAADQVVDGRPYARWTGRNAGTIVVSFPVATSRDGALVPLLIAAVVLAAAGGVVAMRRRPVRALDPPLTSEALLTRIAALDAGQAGRAASEEEKARYARERAALKRALTDQLRREGKSEL